jgi:hypothetical protein
MTKLPYEEFAKGRVRLTPETLTQKYYGLVFGMPLLLVLLIGVIWAVVGVQTGHSSFETPANVASARLMGVIAAFIIWGAVITMNLGDNGHGVLCQAGRMVEPVVNVLGVGARVRRYAHSRARLSPRDMHEKMVAAEERSRSHKSQFSMPWQRDFDPHITRRYLQLVWEIVSAAVWYLLADFFWTLGHMPDRMSMPYVFTLLTEGIWYLAIALIAMRAILTIMLIFNDEPSEERFKGADRILSWIGPKER